MGIYCNPYPLGLYMTLSLYMEIMGVKRPQPPQNLRIYPGVTSGLQMVTNITYLGKGYGDPPFWEEGLKRLKPPIYSMGG